MSVAQQHGRIRHLLMAMETADLPDASQLAMDIAQDVDLDSSPEERERSADVSSALRTLVDVSAALAGERLSKAARARLFRVATDIIHRLAVLD